MSVPIMFIVYDLSSCFRIAAFTSFDDAEAYRKEFDGGRQCIIETVEEDEDLYYSINS